MLFERHGARGRPVGHRELRHVPHVRPAAVHIPLERAQRRHDPLVGTATSSRRCTSPARSWWRHHASWLVSFLIELGVLAVALRSSATSWCCGYRWCCCSWPSQVVFVLGLALMLATASVYFRDLQHLLGLVLQVWFYSAPDRLPDEPRAGSARRTTGVEDHALQPQPPGPIRRGLPRRAVRPALPAARPRGLPDRRVVRLAARRAWPSSVASRARWRRSCERRRRIAVRATAGRSSGSTTSATRA